MTDLIERKCPICGVQYALDKDFYDYRRLNKSEGWYCPNGHYLVIKESDAEKYRREAERLKQQIAQWQDEAQHNLEVAQYHERAAAAYKGHLTRHKKRAKAGTCPCCKRTFQNLARHMATQHPDMDPEENVIDFEPPKKRA